MAKGKKSKVDNPLAVVEAMQLSAAKGMVARVNAKSDADMKAKLPVMVQATVVSAITEDIITTGRVDMSEWRPSARAALRAADAAQARLLEAAAPTV